MKLKIKTIIMVKVRIHAFVSGRVQHVFFRANTKSIAQRLGLTGWVRNLSDGRVEVVAEGEEKNIDKLVDYLHKGPIIARVDEVDVKKGKYTGEFSGFEVRY